MRAMAESLEELRYISLPAARTITRQLGLENITPDALALVNSFLDGFLGRIVATVIARKRRLVVSAARSTVQALLPAGTLAADAIVVADQMQQRTGFERGWPARPEAIVPGYIHERLRSMMLVCTPGDASSSSNNNNNDSSSLLSEADTISGSTARYLTGILEYIGRQIIAYGVENARAANRDVIELGDATRALHFDAQMKHILEHAPPLHDHATISQSTGLLSVSSRTQQRNSALLLSPSASPMSSSGGSGSGMTSLNKPRPSPGLSPKLPPRAPSRQAGVLPEAPMLYRQSASTSNVHDLLSDAPSLSSHTDLELTMAGRHSTDATMSSETFSGFHYSNNDGGNNNNNNGQHNNGCDMSYESIASDSSNNNNNSKVGGIGARLRKYSADSTLVDASAQSGHSQRGTAPTTPTSSTAPPLLGHSTSNGALGKLFRQFRGKRADDTSSPPLPSMPSSSTAPSSGSRTDGASRHHPTGSVGSSMSDTTHGNRHGKSHSVKVEPTEVAPAALGRSTSSEESDNSTSGTTQGKRRAAALPLRLSKSQGDLRRKHNEPTSPKSVSQSRDKMLEFEALISSTETKKMSLTPARMRTIEANEHKKSLQPRDPARALKKLFSSSGSSSNGGSGSNGSSKSRSLSINLRRRGTSKSQPGSPTKPDSEMPPVPSSNDQLGQGSQGASSKSAPSSASSSSSSSSSAAAASSGDKHRSRSRRAPKHVDRMEVLGEELHEEVTDEDSLPPTSRSHSPASVATDATVRAAPSRPLPVPPVKIPKSAAEGESQQIMDSSSSPSMTDLSLHMPSKSQSSLPSPRSIRASRRSQSEDRYQAQHDVVAAAAAANPDATHTTPPTSRTFADLEREHRSKLECSTSRSSSRNSSTKRGASTTAAIDSDSIAASSPITRSVSSSAVDRESSAHASFRPLPAPKQQASMEHMAGHISPGESAILLGRSASHGHTHAAIVHAADSRMSVASMTSFVTANESVNGITRPRGTSDATAVDISPPYAVPWPRNIAVNNMRRDEPSAQNDAERTEKPDLLVRTKPTLADVQTRDTLERTLSSPSSSSVISISEITYSAHTDATTPSYLGKLGSSAFSPRKTSAFSPLDGRHVHDTQVVARESIVLRRAYSFGSLSQPKPHRDFMQVDLSIWQSPDPLSPTLSSIASPGLEIHSVSSATSAPVGGKAACKDALSLAIHTRKKTPECSSSPAGDPEAQQIIAQLQEQVASLQFQLAAEQALRQELEELSSPNADDVHAPTCSQARRPFHYFSSSKPYLVYVISTAALALATIRWSFLRYTYGCLLDFIADVRYVSPRAAKSIVAQCGKIKPTTETLQSVNAFLDELVVHCAELLYAQRRAGKPFPVDVEQAKSALGELIQPGPFYNELLSAAAVAVRHQLRTPKSPGPQSTFGGLTPATVTSAESLAQLLRARCLYYSTLGGDASSFQPAWESDIIDMQSAVFFATALEFIGMHALREGARVAVHKERPLVRMQDTYNVLAADPAVGPAFQKTSVYRNLKRLLLSAKASASSTRLASALTSKSSNAALKQAHVTTEPMPVLDTTKYPEARTPVSPGNSFTEDAGKRPASVIKSASTDRSDSDRMQSPGSGHQATHQSEGSLSSSRERSRGSSDALSKQSAGEGSEVWRVMGLNSPTRVSDQTLEFEDLLKGKDTIKVSLTPNRLNNIEVAKNVAPIRPRGAQKNNVSMLTGRRASIVTPPPPPRNGGSLLTPPAIGVVDDDNSDLSADEDTDDQGNPRRRGETLYEFLNSTGPEDLMSSDRANVKKQASHSAGLGLVREESNSTGGRPNGTTHGDQYSPRSMSGGGSRTAATGATAKHYHASDGDGDDDDDDDDEDADLLLPGQKPRAKAKKEESLADFLRNTAPPEPIATALTPPTPTPTKRPSRGMMRLFSRFNSNSSASSVGSSVADESARPHSTANGSISSSHSASGALDAAHGSSGSRRHVAIKIPYSPPLPDPPALRSPILPSPPMPPPKPVCEERGVQASAPITPTEEKGTSTATRATAEFAAQTDDVVVSAPPAPVEVETAEMAIQTEIEEVEKEKEEKEKEEEEEAPADLPPEAIPLPAPTDEENIALLETEEEREAARRELEASEETLRVPAAVLDLIREALPTLIESGDTATCMEFLEELLTSGKSVRLRHTSTQTQLSGNGWLFQPAAAAAASDARSTETDAAPCADMATEAHHAAATLLTAIPAPPERRRSIA
ncbi:hypothetical protein SYNPS1DRAFT_26636 [Syncephalis pseudoplumigaleata]|uniref:Uncharacterized protein n=1 Tax=Syncephalis pseudoplumigaleata TaxID=1712513 RepID=A0A4P9Z537_9FUNG|nr:hypothetical protein SYNPS1DRAFT_26636 [Syncephalis pseudoplumigaleata]|eukprot:RKP27724.1 hypothetical protein SYNPS1DRAFT_26636 [Syncephalis pseudoplumigaleata]